MGFVTKPVWIIVLTAGILQAQSFAGTWQGTLHAESDRRIVITIPAADDDRLKATLHRIDEPGPGIAATAATRQRSSLKLTFAGVGGNFEGTLSADGNTLTGTWTDGRAPALLILLRATPATAWTIPETPPLPRPMALDANLVFEVATIKPSDPNSPGAPRITMDGRQFVTANVSLKGLITYAYGIHPRQLIGGPAWLETEMYDVHAEPEASGEPNMKQIATMIQRLLASRFQFSFHRERKEMPVYTVEVAKTGAMLAASELDPNDLPRLGFRGLGDMVVRNASVADFTGMMQLVVLEKPVLDQTGLTGRYDFTLRWTPDATQFGGRVANLPAPADGATAPPDLFVAIQQQLGLKLEEKRAPADVLVVDRIERPSAN